jgi:carboxyl-terminal processing protease
MLRKSSLRLLVLACGLSFAWSLRGVDATNQPGPEAKAAAGHIAPGPNDGRIAWVTARMLEQNHYSRHLLDRDYSEKFFDRYLEALDPQHLHFLQSDLAEFDAYRTNLDHLTITFKGVADTTPAYQIFDRFLERLGQRVAYTDELLKNEKFSFDTDERVLINRHEAPYPRDLDEAKQIWRQRLRLEYLQEKLGRADAKKKTNAQALKKESHADDSSPPAKPAEPTPEVKPKTDAEEIVDLLTRRYNRILHTYKEWDNEDVMEAYLTALAHVYDPHSDYFNLRQTAEFAISMNLSLFGIGALLSSDIDGYCKIQELKPGPAMNSKKLKPGDKIVAVAQGDQPPVDVVGMNLNKLVQLIRGPKGTEVRLTIVPADDPSARRVVSLVREEIKLEDQEAKAKVIELPNGAGRTLRLGVIDLPSFYTPFDLPGGRDRSEPKSTTADVARLLKKLTEEKVAGVILDLRRNGGGSLEEAIRLTGLFIKQGPVVQVRAPDGSVQVDEDSEPVAAYDGPLIVLTSRGSASASEIVAGALQDYGRAVIVGDLSTHGKGTVQNLSPLKPWVKPATATATNDPGELKVTIRKFYRPSGASTQLNGVMPDIVLPSVLNYSSEVGEKALENPLPWDTIPSAKFERMHQVTPNLVANLLKRSSDRVATNQDYIYIREDIEQYQKRQADQTVSLNEKQALQEREENEARDQARNKERLARKEPDQKVYELTLKLVEEPGLPLPMARTNAVAARNPGSKGTGSAALSTNSVSVSAKVTAPAVNLDEDPEEEKPPAVDASLDEAEHILADYISIISEKPMISVNR